MTHAPGLSPPINGVGGGPSFHPSPTFDELVGLALAEPPDARLREYRALRYRRSRVHLALKSGLDPEKLRQAGWGLVLPEDEPPGVLDALRPLLDWRGRSMGGIEPRRLVYRRGESSRMFLDRHNQSPGVVDPAKVPYYLLLVGPPTGIPFSVQQGLGVQHAVGRLDFESLDDYRSYAANVVVRERMREARQRRIGVFGPRYDDITRQSNEYLLRPLAHVLAKLEDWRVEEFLGPRAHRQCHLDLLTGESPPAFLLSVCHGRALPLGHGEQRRLQGSQACQPAEAGAGLHRWIAGRDIDASATGPQGQVLFMNGCFSAGTPRENSYLHRGGEEKELCAEEPFTSHLAQRLLAHPQGASAVIGHVDRTWNYSFRWPTTRGPQITSFESTARDLMQGKRVGAAIEKGFGRRFADLCVELVEWQERCRFGQTPDLTLCQIWTARNDAKSTVILGDPAVRLAGVRWAGR